MYVTQTNSYARKLTNVDFHIQMLWLSERTNFERFRNLNPLHSIIKLDVFLYIQN